MKYLEYKNITYNPCLAKRLPPEVAFRFHALPVAEENNKITVAMANPENEEAKVGVLKALGKTAHVVRADSREIDYILSELWPEYHQHLCSLVVWEYSQDLNGEGESNIEDNCVIEYATDLGQLIKADVKHFKKTAVTKENIDSLNREISRRGYELIVAGSEQQAKRYRNFFDVDGNKVARLLTTSVLLVRQPRWPIHQILLIPLFNENDDIAANWIIRLARPCGAFVTVLSIFPNIPVAYRVGSQMQLGLDSILASNTTSGIWLRNFSKRLDQWNISGEICIRQGEPGWLIQQEIERNDFDVVVISAEVGSRLTQWLFGGFVGSLLRWVDRPVLIAR
jgi:nucleotide-binding universal stress UspA family protein